MTLSEMPKQILIAQPAFELQLGIQLPNYIMEAISTRTLKHKMIHDIKPEPHPAGGIVKAPSGYRISRLWKKRVSLDTEVIL